MSMAGPSERAMAVAPEVHSSHPLATIDKSNLTTTPTPADRVLPPSPAPPSSRDTCAQQHENASDPIQAANMINPDLQIRPANSSQPQHITFFQKYFTKSVDSTSDPEKDQQPHQTAFSFLSLGSVITAIIMLFILFGVVAAALALTLDHKHHRKATDAGEYLSPIRMAIPSNFPDPSLWYENGTWYAFATNNAAGVNNPPGQGWRAKNFTENFGEANVQLATSQDFGNWTLVDLEDQPLPFVGSWTGTHKNGAEALSYPKLSSTWAPAVIRNDQGQFVMYYASAVGGPNPYANWSAWHPQPHCIGVATADQPQGPFVAQNTSIACPIEQGGAIDPEAIHDVDGTIWLVYKVDGNNIGHGGQCGNMETPIRPTPIMLQRMASDGITTVGEPIQILTNTEEDGPLVEAPMLVRSHEGIYFLFFSSGCTRFASYTTKYATATSITGPYERHNTTLLQTGDFGLEAPGSVGIAADGSGGFNMAFHARVQFGEVGRVRAMYTTKLNFTGHEVTFMRERVQLD